MLNIDKAILDTSKNISKNISVFDETERGLLSQNILSQIRNLIEYIFQKINANGQDADPNNYEHKNNAKESISSLGQYRFLYKFHSLTQKSVSHYTIDENGSERLMLKYYEYLLRTKILMKNMYNLDIIHNIEDFPLDLDKTFDEYYQKISHKILNPSHSNQSNYIDYNDRYYIQKIKPIFVKGSIYYEVTFTIADDKVSKFDRIIAFTKFDLMSNYAVKLEIRDDFVEVLNEKVPIKIIESWEVSIRPCELRNFAKVFNPYAISINPNLNEYKEVMKQLRLRNANLIEVIDLNEINYSSFIKNIEANSNTRHILDVLDKCREISIKKLPGHNIIRYLLLSLNNKIIKRQLNQQPCSRLSDLCIKWGCVPFEQMPYATSLVNHNPKIHDLFEVIDSSDRKHEFLARFIKNKAEVEEVLFTPIKDLEKFNNLDALVNDFNSRLYYKHTGRSLLKYRNHIYTKEYVEDCLDIISQIRAFTKAGVKNYTISFNNWLQENSYIIDCNEKLDLLRNIFTKSRVALVYGPAGTGKSTLINHLSHYWNNNRKLYLAQTNPAINNLKRKVNTSNSNFMTISKFLSKKNFDFTYDLLVIDECSTVSNKDMKSIMEKIDTKLLVLVGDTFQIESIRFGNWFSVIGDFIDTDSVLELRTPYRTSNNNLLTIWERVRELDDAILEPIVKYGYSAPLDNSILNKPTEDEIILCLNYDGIYGINNLNKFLQSINKNPPVYWGVNTYKIDDPILFNEVERFSPLIHNNMKGKIVGIEKGSDDISFSIALNTAINEINAFHYNFELLSNQDNGNSIIKFKVRKYPGTDEDGDYTSSLVPFQIAYAVSIHKAQGLEYKSVKIVITNDVEEMITHNIFYTAITRARENLRIYWTPETEKSVLDSFTEKSFSKDINFLKSLE